ncbi:hypothetical protein GCM10008931_44080 [Oceanobacillus oncorhynchi subsp. oncorhynchi]|uniref:dTMP kinase n=1 Tax=Oceanobacillus oncorhynchi TaxID=545501 RepID=UPI0031DFC8B1
MKIIAIEGLDKAGKASQAKLLFNYLTSLGYKVEKSEFHRYDTPTGELVAKWLKKEWEVDQKTIELIMTADKQAQQSWFEELQQSGADFLILDRYTGSQEVYAEANGMNLSWVKSLQRYMRPFYIEIFIDIPPDVSMSRKGKHNGGKNDRYEEDYNLLKKVRNLYLERKNIVVDGTLPIKSVHMEITNKLNNALNLNQ